VKTKRRPYEDELSRERSAVTQIAGIGSVASHDAVVTGQASHTRP
jgi:hypothetical protein